MHLRFSACIGLPVVEEGDHEHLGSISRMLMHPDTGKIEGFFVRSPGLLGSEEEFLSVLDILRWGIRIEVRSTDVLCDPADHIRLQPMLLERRPVLGQQMMTERGVKLGRCRDIQFDSRHFMVEWLFPKKWLRWGTPVPVSAIIEVRTDAIIVRDSVAKEKVEVGTANPAAMITGLPEVAEARISGGPMKRKL